MPPKKPDAASMALVEFHKKILSWNYYQLLQQKKSGQAQRELTKVPASFSSAEEYLSIFEPLVLEECTAIIMNGDEDTGKGACEANAAVVSTMDRGKPFQLVRFVMEDGVPMQYSENDVILLSKVRPGDRESTEIDELLHALGLVESHEGGTGLRVRFHLDEASQTGSLGGQGALRVQAVRSGLQTPESCWFILKLANLATISREWAALTNVRAVPFLQTLLTGRAGADIVHRSRNLVVPGAMREVLENSYNQPQIQAVTAGLGGNGVVLIQGPPGTGKTKTILGLLSIIMHSAPAGTVDRGAYSQYQGDENGKEEDDSSRLWGLAAPWLSGHNGRDDLPAPEELMNPSATLQDEIYGLALRCTARRISEAAGPKAHVLVCAPSNSALDEIVLRILSSGLTDGQGRAYTPSVVRVGVNIHHSVQAVSLENLVRTRRSQLEAAGKVVSRQDLDRIRLTILEEASIICSTLAFSGSGVFAKMGRRFDAIVIDEAAQAVEPSVLVALTQGASQVYMVGDPNQLPATVISRRAVTFGYSSSLFARLQAAGYPVNRLTTQYRMHPLIREFPSNAFYEGMLEDGANMATSTSRPWHQSPCLGPLAFFDLRGREESPPHSASIYNPKEAACVVALYLELADKYPELRQPDSVGIVSPYKAQVKLIQEHLASIFGEELARKRVDVNTVDGFQGREKDIVIFSTVRARQNRPIGFVADERRINVGLTRARSSLIVVGHAGALRQDQNWGTFAEHCRKKDRMFRVPAGRPYQNVAHMASLVTHFRAQVKDLVSGKIPHVDPSGTGDEYFATKEQGEEAEPEDPLPTAGPRVGGKSRPQSLTAAAGPGGKKRGRGAGGAGGAAAAAEPEAPGAGGVAPDTNDDEEGEGDRYMREMAEMEAKAKEGPGAGAEAAGGKKKKR